MSLEYLKPDEAQRQWELYVLWCENRGIRARPDEFTIWLEER